MRTDTPKTIYLKDYKPYPYTLTHVDLNFDIHDGYTTVTAITHFQRPEDCHEDLFLNGEDMELVSIKLNGEDLEAKRYNKTALGMTIAPPEDTEFTLEIVTKIEPEKNTRLEGLYQSGGTYCTQCEAEGFRRITYYPDRPDVMATFTVRVEATEDLPVLLSNGNLKESGKAENGRHFAVWHDPFVKPCYLFALVAGDLTHIHDTFTTMSGRKVDLYIYVRPGDESQCDHAMQALKDSMKWEEDVYGLEYDLDLFNIVAVSDFNMGAMENKSLNIFNTALVLAHPDTATDTDFMRVESVIAHEYFHNWSGNRVTCRDWFQLSLKEGLTVFRDQEFSSDMHSRPVQRIDDVSHLRRFQFSEDAGPLAHPIRPDNYIEINNFYTMTVYEKGAEIIRMMHTIMGPERYRKGTDLYFERHDGQAVTCDDFVQCMEEASGVDLHEFKLWYSQAGTPEVHFASDYNEDTKTYAFEISQETPDTPGQTGKKPVHIPIRMALLGKDGTEMNLGNGKTEITLHLKEANQSFEINNIPSKPVPSVLRNFSAPIKLDYRLENTELAFLMLHDSDGFNRWEAAQNYALRSIQKLMDDHSGLLACYARSYGELLDLALEPDADKALMTRLLSIPDVSRIGQQQTVVDPEAIYDAREHLRNALLDQYKDKIIALYNDNKDDGPYEATAEAMGKRALKNTALLHLSNVPEGDDIERCKQAYHSATNMTDRMAALQALSQMPAEHAEEAFADFYDRFKDYALVIDKFFAVQATAVREDIFERLAELRAHEDFNIRNPNRVRSLYAAFAMNNPVCFHRADGKGYNFLKDAIIELNKINPQIAARLLTPMREWRRYTPDRQDKMKAALEEILKTPDLSPDVFEIASKSVKG